MLYSIIVRQGREELNHNDPRACLILEKGDILRVCYCCGISHSTTSDDFYKIDRFYNKPVLKAKSDSGKRIVAEIVYITVCQNCNNYVVEIKRYIHNSRGKRILEETETLRGIEAYKYYFDTAKNRIEYPLPSPFLAEKPHGKTIPFIYGKTQSAIEQIPRYIDESGNAGNIIENKVLCYK